MSLFYLTEVSAAPGTPDTNKFVFYVKPDGLLYFKNDAGVETPFRPVGGGTGDLLSDGTVPLVANWDVGAFKITANQLESDVVTGTAPLIVASTTLVTNLNADKVDGADLIDEDTMVSDSDVHVPTQQSVKAYVDSSVAGGVEYKGVYDASTNTPDLDTTPAGVIKGDMYIVSVAGTFFTTAVEVGDALIAEIDAAAVEADWSILQGNIQYTGAQIESLYNSQVAAASQVEMEAGTETAIRRMTPERVAQAIAALAPSGAVEFADSDWRVTGSVDATKKVAFEVDGLTTGTTRTITMPDANVDLGNVPSGALFEGTKYLGVNDQTGTTYELVLADAGKLVTMDNAAASVVTIPANASVPFPIGARVDILWKGVGVTSVSITTDTLNAAGGTNINAQWEIVSLIKIAATEWVMVGGVA